MDIRTTNTLLLAVNAYNYLDVISVEEILRVCNLHTQFNWYCSTERDCCMWQTIHIFLQEWYLQIRMITTNISKHCC